MPSKYLLIVRAGETSLHPNWLNPPGERLWDLHISYFGNREKTDALPDGVSFSREIGPKFIGLADCLEKHPEFFDRYAYIGLADDDLDADAHCWNTAFSTLDRLGAALGQPSLDWRSFYYHDIVLRRPQFEYRVTDFVELMAPLVRTDFLRDILPTFRCNQSSIGLDHLWRVKGNREGKLLAIVDSCSMRHTRRMEGGTQYKVAEQACGKKKDQELRELIEKYGITDLKGHTLYGVRPDGSRDENREALNTRLEEPRRAQKRRLRWIRLKKFFGAQ
ncbi:MAG TPA: hypothetical protein VMF58_17360 [Rhizomicrobium sp.]|nr:hypothetical protein [Rhizomicrobium sp.]